jgi:hypothetical protein
MPFHSQPARRLSSWKLESPCWPSLARLGQLGEERVGAVDVAVVELEVDLDLLVRDAVQALEGGVVLGPSASGRRN